MIKGNIYVFIVPFPSNPTENKIYFRAYYRFGQSRLISLSAKRKLTLRIVVIIKKEVTSGRATEAMENLIIICINNTDE